MSELIITKASDVDEKDNPLGYVFVSYASVDKSSVFDKIIIPIQKKYGLRVYADEDFAYDNDNWTNQMKKNMKGSKAAVLFVSDAYICSYACFLEVLTAIKEDIPIIRVYLVDTLSKRGTDKKTLTISDKTKSAILKVGKQLEAKKVAGTMGKMAAQGYDVYLEVEDMIQNSITEKELSDAFADLIKSFDSNIAKASDDIETIKSKIESAVDKKYNGVSVFGEVPSNTDSVKNVKPEEKKNEDDKNIKVNKDGKDESYVIYGKKGSGNQSQMMIDAIQAIIEKHPDKLDELAFSLISIQTKPLKELKGISYFNIGQECKINGTIYSIGTAFGRDAKLTQIRKAIMVAREDPHAFEIEGLFDDKQLKKAEKQYEEGKNGTCGSEEISEQSGGDEVYTIYGKKGSGNQSQMMTEAIRVIIEKHFDMLDEIADELICVAVEAMDNLNGITYFRSGESYTYNGVVYSIGTSFGRDSKLAQIRKAIMVTGENPHAFEIDGLFNDKQLKKAEIRYEEKKKEAPNNAKAGMPQDVPESDKNYVDILACFLSKYNNEAAALLGYRSVNAAILAYSEKWDLKVSSIRNIRDTFDPFFPESGRKGWWQNMDSISDKRKAIIDKFKTFNDVNEAFDYVRGQIPDIE